ncbi:MAG: alternative ribosome rescue aminoacyl-tRNA hydrolase ArfB [Actinomycetota bacterium]
MARDPDADDRLVVTDRVRIPAFELQETFSASGGPGGQHANKAATRVELTFVAATSSAFAHEADRQRVIDALGQTVRVVADDERSQHRNRSIARQRLVDQLRSALRPRRQRRRTRPTRGSQRRRLQAKSERAQIKKLRRRPDVDE